MQGKHRIEYEKAFGEYVGALGARAFGLGRHALVILLKSLNVNEGNRIGVCGFTCLSVIEAVKLCGAVPVYLDVDEHLCIAPEEIPRQGEGALKVVILQHTFGNPGKLEQVLSACNKIGAKVIEDCAHSLGCSWKGKALGNFGEGAIFSFQWGKPYTTGQGGMLTVNSRQLLDRVDQEIERMATLPTATGELILECQRRFSPIFGGSKLEIYLRHSYAEFRNTRFNKEFPQLDFHLYPGYIKLAGEMTAKAGLKQIRNWPKLQRLRLQNTQMIEEYFNKAGLPLWPRQKEAHITALRYPLLVPNKTEIINQADKCGLDIGGWYISPVHPLQEYLAKVDYQKGRCRNAESMIERLVHLPTGTELTMQRLEAMMKIICESNTQGLSKQH
jgi:perosamine synthetase